MVVVQGKVKAGQDVHSEIFIRNELGRYTPQTPNYSPKAL